jgi:hypothetical protein
LEPGAAGCDITRKHRRGIDAGTGADRLTIDPVRHRNTRWWPAGSCRRCSRSSIACSRPSRIRGSRSSIFWLTAISGIGLLVGLYTLLAGNPAIEPLLGISSLAFYAGMLLFAFIALPAIWRS